MFDSYYTIAYVKFDSPRLARLYYILLFLLLWYAGFSLFYQQGYLEFDNPAGVIRLRMKSPEKVRPIEDNVELSMSYGMDFKQWDEFDAAVPSPLLGEYVFVTTEVSDVVEKLGMDGRGMTKWEKVHTHHFFVHAPEDFTLKIEHTMYSSKFYDEERNTEYAESNRHLNGSLVQRTPGREEELLVSFDSEKADAVSVGTLLQSAGVTSLEQMSDSVGHEDETLRQRGLALYVNLWYSNLEWWGITHPYYVYWAERLPETGYKVAEELAAYPHADWEAPDDGSYRVIRKRHGIFIKFQQCGQLGKLSWKNIIFHIASIGSLLAGITSLVDFLGGNLPKLQEDFKRARCVATIERQEKKRQHEKKKKEQAEQERMERERNEGKAEHLQEKENPSRGRRKRTKIRDT